MRRVIELDNLCVEREAEMPINIELSLVSDPENMVETHQVSSVSLNMLSMGPGVFV